MGVDGQGAARHGAARLKELPVRRPDGGWQLGVEHGQGVIVDGLSATDWEPLRRLDSTARSHLVIDEDRATADIAAVLDDAGLFEPILRPTSGARVVVDGTGPVVTGIVTTLRSAGLPLTQGGAYAVEAALESTTPALDLAVVVTGAPLHPSTTAPLQRRGIRHLPLAFGPDGFVVGPLIEPGSGPCVECLDRGRTDKDPGWPWVRGLTPGDRHRRGIPDPCLVTLAVATTALLVESALDGTCPLGTTLETRLPWPRLVQREWPTHPACSCGAFDRLSGASVTMRS